jgi:hypothetical protein
VRSQYGLKRLGDAIFFSYVTGDGLVVFFKVTLQSPIKLERCRQWCLLANVLTEKHLAKNRLLFDKVHSVTPAI